jgi:hypothetical protein
MLASKLGGKNAWIAWACKGLALALPATVAWQLLVVPAGVLLQAGGMAQLHAALAAPGGLALRWGMSILAMVPVACMAFALWQAAYCFARFARSEYFTLHVVRNLRRMSLGLLAAAVASILMRPLVSLWLSLGMPAGQRAVVFGFGSQDLVLLLMAALLWQITSVMERAVALSEENQQFI